MSPCPVFKPGIASRTGETHRRTYLHTCIDDITIAPEADQATATACRSTMGAPDTRQNVDWPFPCTSIAWLSQRMDSFSSGWLSISSAAPLSPGCCRLQKILSGNQRERDTSKRCRATTMLYLRA